MNKDILVNKFYPLDKGFVPENLVKVNLLETPKLIEGMLTYLDEETYKMFMDFRTEGLSNGINMIVDSGYRPYEYQEYILKYNLMQKGLSAYKTVALPGESEHQTGLALDFALIINGVIVDNFDDTFDEVKWIHENSYKYGFILRYPKGKENITGFSYECWHLRYVGKDVSYFMHNENISTLEEYHLLNHKKTQKILVKQK